MIADYDAVRTSLHAHESVLWAQHTLGNILLSAPVACITLQLTKLLLQAAKLDRGKSVW
jgi:hypothetical protein